MTISANHRDPVPGTTVTSPASAAPVPRTPAEKLLQLATGYWRTQAIAVAAAFGIADELASGPPRQPGSLAAALGTDADATARLLAFLAACGVVSGDSRSGYTLTPVGELLRGDVPGSMRDLAMLYGGEFYAAWGRLDDAIRDGGSAFGHAFGQELFAYMAAHPDTACRYDRTMSAGTAFFRKVPEAFGFPPGATVIDVAGGDGSLLAQVLAANPSARGVLFDVDHVLERARPELVSGGLYADRCAQVAGDYFRAVPEGGDVYLLSRVLHSHDDATACDVLARCRQAMAPGGAVLVIERVLGSRPRDVVAAGYDLHMLSIMGEGRERDEAGFRGIFAASGLSVEAIHPLSLGVCLVVGRG